MIIVIGTVLSPGGSPILLMVLGGGGNSRLAKMEKSGDWWFNLTLEQLLFK